jgi:hypothetical protein
MTRPRYGALLRAPAWPSLRLSLSALLIGVVAAACGGTAGPTPTPTPLPSGAIVAKVVVQGVDYADSFGPPAATITELEDGSVRMENHRPGGVSLEVDWQLPAGSLPDGAQIINVDARICGEGSGDFWESYGPQGAEPVEYEARPPAADGCWHFLGGHGPQTQVEAYVVGDSVFVVERVEYDITYLP